MRMRLAGALILVMVYPITRDIDLNIWILSAYHSMLFYARMYMLNGVRNGYPDLDL